MEGQSALVAGGGSGIGRGVVEAFVAEGASVGVLEIDPAKVEKLNADFGGKVRAVCGDVTSWDDNVRLVSETVEAFGGVDTLVSVAGLWDYSASVTDMSPEVLASAFDEMFGVNVKAILFAVKASLDQLLQSNGSIILTASNAAFYPGGGGVLYTGSKFAVRGLVIQLAYELAPKVRVNGVAPGGTVTPLRGLKSLEQDQLALTQIPGLSGLMESTCPLHHAWEPADHASAYVYLAARGRANAVTGVIINSDGGLGVRGITKLSGLASSDDLGRV
jgi:2,3-dihydroxy-2,3-dihydrophenylpropionate dehydrogenase